MATTARKKKEVKVALKEGIKLPPLPMEEEEEVDPKSKEFLDPSHLMQVEVMGRDIINAELNMALEEQHLSNMLLSLELLQIKIEKQRILLASKDQKYKISVEKFTNYKKEIWPEYGLNISEPMGYDPISGEIKRE